MDKILALEHFAHVLHAHQYLQGDDHEHQLGLVDLVGEGVDQGQPEGYIGEQHEDEEHHEQEKPVLHSHIEVANDGGGELVH